MQNLPDIPLETAKLILNRKEMQCYLLTKEGKIGKQIAGKLFLESRQAVYKMQQRIIQKIDNHLQ